MVQKRWKKLIGGKFWYKKITQIKKIISLKGNISHQQLFAGFEPQNLLSQQFLIRHSESQTLHTCFSISELTTKPNTNRKDQKNFGGQQECAWESLVASIFVFCLLLRYPSRSVIFRTFFFSKKEGLCEVDPAREMQPILICCWCLLTSSPQKRATAQIILPKLFVFQSQGGLNNKRQTTIPSRVARKKFQIKRENLNIWKFTFFDSIFTEYHFWLWWRTEKKSWDDMTTTANNNTFPVASPTFSNN